MGKKRKWFNDIKIKYFNIKLLNILKIDISYFYILFSEHHILLFPVVSQYEVIKAVFINKIIIYNSLMVYLK